MDISQYRCRDTISSWKFTLKHKLNLDDPKGFFFVKTQKKFDLSAYTGEFPVGIVLNNNYVIGWSADKEATNIFELEPHISQPKKGYYWCDRIPKMDLPYREAIDLLNYRCVQLSAPDQSYFDKTSLKKFEDSRHVLWACVIWTKCIDLNRLIELEINYMKRCVNQDILNRCKDLYDLQYPNVTCLQDWISTQYKAGRFGCGTTDKCDYFDNCAKCVKEMLT